MANGMFMHGTWRQIEREMIPVTEIWETGDENLGIILEKPDGKAFAAAVVSVVGLPEALEDMEPIEGLQCSGAKTVTPDSNTRE